MQANVRTARDEDFDALLAALETVAAERHWIAAEPPLDRDAKRAEFQRALQDDHALSLVAEAGGEIVGSRDVEALSP